MLYRGGRGSRVLENKAEIEGRSAGEVKGTGGGPKFAWEADRVSRWEDAEQGNGCYGWLSQWRTCSIYVIAGVYELYEQLLPTRVYYSKKTRTGPEIEIMCRLCGKAAESVGQTPWRDVLRLRKASICSGIMRC